MSALFYYCLSIESTVAFVEQLVQVSDRGGGAGVWRRSGQAHATKLQKKYVLLALSRVSECRFLGFFNFFYSLRWKEKKEWKTPQQDSFIAEPVPHSHYGSYFGRRKNGTRVRTKESIDSQTLFSKMCFLQANTKKSNCHRTIRYRRKMKN